MPLDSTAPLSIATDGNPLNKQEQMPCPEDNERKDSNAGSWVYLFVRRNKVNIVNSKLQEKFDTFIHTHIVYKRDNKRVRNVERPTISGLVFVHGDGLKVQAYINQNFLGVYLAKDCSTGKIASIRDKAMQPFMQASKINPARIRFMPHPFEYYSEGNQLVQITSGVLAGLEGYRIRIARDRCIVTTLGGMTVSIGGIHNESFEDVDEYVKQRQSQTGKMEFVSQSALTLLQQEIDKSFFNPTNQLDVMAILQGLNPWLERAETAVQEKEFNKAVEISAFILEEMGSRFAPLYHSIKRKQAENISTVGQKFNETLSALLTRSDVSPDLKATIETSRESLVIRFPFLQIDI